MTALAAPPLCTYCGTQLAPDGSIAMGDGTAACADQAACHEREMEARGLR